jgi:hypothetical protein
MSTRISNNDLDGLIAFVAATRVTAPALQQNHDPIRGKVGSCFFVLKPVTRLTNPSGRINLFAQEDLRQFLALIPAEKMILERGVPGSSEINSQAHLDCLFEFRCKADRPLKNTQRNDERTKMA